MSDEIRSRIVKVVQDLDEVLQVKDEVREELIRLTRDLVRYSGDVITAIHNKEYDAIPQLIETIRSIKQKIDSIVENHPDLKYTGLINNALSEFVEAMLFYGIILENRFYTHKDLEVHHVPYLLGLADLVGELKRYAIDALRSDDVSTAYRMLEIIECIYNALRKLDYPDALVPGLRHKVDIMRKVIEDLRIFILDIDKRIRLVKLLSTQTTRST